MEQYVWLNMFNVPQIFVSQPIWVQENEQVQCACHTTSKYTCTTKAVNGPTTSV